MPTGGAEPMERWMDGWIEVCFLGEMLFIEGVVAL